MRLPQSAAVRVAVEQEGPRYRGGGGGEEAGGVAVAQQSRAGRHREGSLARSAPRVREGRTD